MITIDETQSSKAGTRSGKSNQLEHSLLCSNPIKVNVLHVVREVAKRHWVNPVQSRPRGLMAFDGSGNG